MIRSKATWEDWFAGTFSVVWLISTLTGAIIIGEQAYTWFEMGQWPTRPLSFYLPAPDEWTSRTGLQKSIEILIGLPTSFVLILAPLLARPSAHRVRALGPALNCIHLTALPALVQLTRHAGDAKGTVGTI
jgi:hypothetical protein